MHLSETSFGFGITLAGAVGPFLLVWDNNYNFTDVEVVVELVPAFSNRTQSKGPFTTRQNAGYMGWEL